jgi:hypothetical protein
MRDQRAQGEGRSLDLLGGGANNIMLSNFQFVLKVVDDNSIARVFLGIEGMKVK